MQEEDLELLPAKNITEWLVGFCKNTFDLPTYSSWNKDFLEFQNGSKALPKEYIQVDYSAFVSNKYESNSCWFDKIFVLYIKYMGDLEELTDKIIEQFSDIESFTTQRGTHTINIQGGQPDSDANANVMVIQLSISQQ